MRPRFRIKADGDDVTELIADRLLSLEVAEESGESSDRLEIMVDNRDWAVDLPETGAHLRVWLGYDETDLVAQGMFQVDELAVTGWPLQIEIQASAADLKETYKQPRSESYHDTTIGGIIEEVAGRHGLEPMVSDDYAAIAIRHRDQTAESDAHFVNRLARDVGALAKPTNGRLIFTRKGQGKSASGDELEPIEIRPEGVTDFRMRIAERRNYRSVTARYVDQDDAEEKEVTVGDGEPAYMIGWTYESEDEAEDAAQARLEGFERGTRKLDLTLVGDPAIATEVPLDLQGFGAGVNGRWIASRVSHRIDGVEGYTTEVTAERNAENG